MKGFKKALRESIYAALDGNTSADGIADGNASINSSWTKYIVIGDVVEGTNNNSFETFRTDAITHLLICEKVDSTAFNHDGVDTIEDEVLQVLIPSVDTAGFSVSGFQVVNTQKVASGYSDEFGSENNLAKIVLQIKTQLVQI